MHQVTLEMENQFNNIFIVWIVKFKKIIKLKKINIKNMVVILKWMFRLNS